MVSERAPVNLLELQIEAIYPPSHSVPSPLIITPSNKSCEMKTVSRLAENEEKIPLVFILANSLFFPTYVIHVSPFL